MRTRAAVLHEYGAPWSVEDINLDPPRAGEVLLQLVAAGLCHSDEHIRQGLMAAPKDVLGTLGLPSMSPTIGGHEGSGVVIEVGDGVSQFTPGGHVVTSFVAVSGKCRWCTSGMEYICDVGAGTLAPGMPTDHTFRHHTTDGQNLGHVSKIGAFAEHTVVSADSIVKVDPHLPLIPAALLAFAIPNGYGSAVHRANVREGDTVVVVGTGGIGTAALQGARINGALCIVAVEPVEFKRAARACSPGCRHDRSGRSTSTCNPRSDIAMLAGLYQSGKLRLDEMVTKRYRLDEINDAYADLKNGELIRGVIDFGIS